MRFLSCLLLVAATFAASAYDYKVGNLCYNMNGDGTVSVSPERPNSRPAYASLSGEVIIPKEVVIENKSYTVTGINANAFFGCSGITSVVVGDAVTQIESYAFKQCSGLTSVTFGRSVASIGVGCFSDCSSLTTFDVPSLVSQLQGEMFYNCKALNTLNLPSALTVIGDGVFSYCSKLETIDGGENVVRIGRCNLEDTKWFKNLPDGLIYFGKVALAVIGDMPESLVIKEGTMAIADYFIRTDYVYNVTFPSTLKEIGNHSFESCRNLNNVTFPPSLEIIGEMAFDNALAFTEVDIPDNVTTLGRNAFSRSKNIVKLTIGRGVTSIGATAFVSCSGLQNIYSYPDPDNVTLGNNVFNYVPTSTCVLHVAANLLDKYQNANQWKAFMPNIVGDLTERPDVTVVGDLTGDGVVDVDDLNMVINMMINKVDETPEADLTGDGMVDVDDLNVMINMMLHKI